MMKQLSELTEDDVYSPAIAALAYNISDALAMVEVEEKEQFDRLFLLVLKKINPPDLHGIDLNNDKIDATLDFYLSPSSPVYGQCVDITTLEEYTQELPDISDEINKVLGS